MPVSYAESARRVRQLPGRFWLLWTCTFVNRLGTSVVALLALYLATDRRLSATSVGLLIAARGAGTVLSPVIGGRLTDRYGTRLAMSWGMALNAAALLATAAARSPATLAVAVVALGLTDSLYRPGMTQSMTTAVTEPDRALAFELQFLAISLGTAISAAAAGFLAEHSFLLIFVLDATTSAVFAVVALVFLGDRGVASAAAAPLLVTTTSGARAGASSAPTPLTPVAVDGPRGRRARQLFLLATGLFAAVYALTLTALPLHMVRAGLTTGDYGLALSLNALLVLVVQPAIAPLMLHYSSRVLLTIGQGTAGLAIASTAFWHSMPTVLGSVVVWSLAEVAVGARGTALAAKMSLGAARPGRVLGAYSSAYAVGALAGGSLGSTLAAAGHEGALWAGCVVAAMTGVLAQALSSWAGGPGSRLPRPS